MVLGRIGYDAYAKSTGGKTFDGRDMPTFDEVLRDKPHVAKAWDDAATQVMTEASGGGSSRSLTAYDPSETFSFGRALLMLKAGRRVARTGWNGKGMWIALTPASKMAVTLARSGAADHAAHEALSTGAGEIHICPHIDMKAADGSLVIGWLASQTDMLANDWRIV